MKKLYYLKPFLRLTIACLCVAYFVYRTEAPVISGEPAAAPSSPVGTSPSESNDTELSSTVILVDKKTNQLQVCEYTGIKYRVLKTYHAIFGSVKGDKEDENDLKTPEGIYTFTALLKPGQIQPKLGAMAFAMNFPNAFDQLAGRKGNGIMVHGTNEPDRLKKSYDTQGCIVVRNEELEEIRPYIRLGLTPILVFAELTPEYLTPGSDTKLRQFFNSWVNTWETMQLDAYVNHYHTDFVSQDKNKQQWKDFKGTLNKKYSEIQVRPEDVFIYRHPKYSMVTFTQNYTSKLRGGGAGLRSRGTKILFIAEESNQFKIIAETYTPLMW